MQAQFLIPMAISLAYGVLIGTIFILIFFPVLIMLLNDVQVYLQKLWTGVKPEREDVEITIIYQKKRQRFEASRRAENKSNAGPGTILDKEEE